MAREKIRKYSELTIGVQPPALIQGAGSTAELQFFLQGPDLQQLEKYAQQIKAKLAADSRRHRPRQLVRSGQAGDSRASSTATRPPISTSTLLRSPMRCACSSAATIRSPLIAKATTVTMLAARRQTIPQVAAGARPAVCAFGNARATCRFRMWRRSRPATGPTQIERYNRQRQILITANLVKGQCTQQRARRN